jgi:hypothetical protein
MPIGLLPATDIQLFSKWVWEQREKTNFDMATIEAPRSCIIKVTKGEEVLAYVPVQPVIFIESLCADPHAAKDEMAMAFYKIQEQVKTVMRDSGHAEAYFVTKDGQFADFAEGHGWKKYMFDSEKNAWLMKLQIKQKPDANPNQSII